MDSEKITAYRCNVCGKLYDSRQEAFDCHGATEEMEGWMCGRCGTIHKTKEEADACL